MILHCAITLPARFLRVNTCLHNGRTKYYSSEPVIEVTEAGNYSVEFEDYRGTGTDSIRVTQSEQLMEAQFLMASVISLADTVIIFEFQPVPDSIRIILPKGLNVDSGQYYRYVTARTQERSA